MPDRICPANMSRHLFPPLRLCISAVCVSGLLMLAAYQNPVWAEENKKPKDADLKNVVIMEATITGSREQPKVISIVPWQDPPGEADMYEDVRSVIADEIMQPLDREVFIRQSNYHSRLFRDAWSEHSAQHGKQD
jgi:hypothetical protein